MTNHQITARWLLTTPHHSDAPPDAVWNHSDAPLDAVRDHSDAPPDPFRMPSDVSPDVSPDAAPFAPAREFTCACGVPLPDQTSAELHAMELNLCTTCFGTAHQEPILGYTRPCTACAGTGRRGSQLIWQLAHAEAERAITLPIVRALLPSHPFRLSELADMVRAHLGLPPGRLPVGPRVRDILLHLQSQGELTLLSAPDRLLDGTDVVLYQDPHWLRTS